VDELERVVAETRTAQARSELSEARARQVATQLQAHLDTLARTSHASGSGGGAADGGVAASQPPPRRRSGGGGGAPTPGAADRAATTTHVSTFAARAAALAAASPFLSPPAAVAPPSAPASRTAAGATGDASAAGSGGGGGLDTTASSVGSTGFRALNARADALEETVRRQAAALVTMQSERERLRLYARRYEAELARSGPLPAVEGGGGGGGDSVVSDVTGDDRGLDVSGGGEGKD
jgi:hypothetical protein